MNVHSDWITPEQLAERMGRSVRWVKDRMASGDLPSVKVGGVRYWTPGCMEELERKQLQREDEAAGWGRIGRRRSA
jgi:hypothetical protein